MPPSSQHQEHPLPSPSEFALIPGAVAWARRGCRPTATSGGGAAAHQVEVKLATPVSSSDDLWWPCILYPSWSHAAKESGLLGSLTGDRDAGGGGGVRDSSGSGSTSTPTTPHAVRIAGCRKAVAVKYLRKNMVPERAALRPRVGGTKQPGKQTRVVAHFLGLDPFQTSAIAAWGPVEMESLRPYRRDAYDVLKSYRGRVARSDWTDLLRAVDEASTALEDWSVSSKELLLNIPEEEEEAAAHADGGRTAAADDDAEPAADHGQTPEYYDDWRGWSESQSQRNTQFSQVHFSQAQSSQERSAGVNTAEKEQVETNGNSTGKSSEDEPTATNEEGDDKASEHKPEEATAADGRAQSTKANTIWTPSSMAKKASSHNSPSVGVSDESKEPQNTSNGSGGDVDKVAAEIITPTAADVNITPADKLKKAGESDIDKLKSPPTTAPSIPNDGANVLGGHAKGDQQTEVETPLGEAIALAEAGKSPPTAESSAKHTAEECASGGKEPEQTQAADSTSSQQENSATAGQTATPFPGAKVSKVTPSPHNVNPAEVAEEIMEGDSPDESIDDDHAKRLFREGASVEKASSPSVSKKRPAHEACAGLLVDNRDETSSIKRPKTESEKEQGEVTLSVDESNVIFPHSQEEHDKGELDVAEEEVCTEGQPLSFFTQAFYT